MDLIPDNKNSQTLPIEFSIKLLDRSDTREIHSFLNDNYVEDTQCGLKTFLELDYVYWYLKRVNKGMALGLLYKKKLIGMIMSQENEVRIGREIRRVFCVGYFCVHKKLRNMSLGKELQRKMSDMIVISSLKDGIPPTVIFSLLSNMPALSEREDMWKVSHKSYAIPLNYSKLKDIGILPSDCKEISFSKREKNPPVLLNQSHIPSIVLRLNKFLESFRVHTYINEDYASHYFIPKKRISYSFCWIGSNGEIDAFINFIESKNVLCQPESVGDRPLTIPLTTAHLNYYFYDKSHNLTEMVEETIPYLIEYGSDHLVINSMGHNDSIRIPKFVTNTSETTYIYGKGIGEVFSDEIFVPTQI